MTDRLRIIPIKRTPIASILTLPMSLHHGHFPPEFMFPLSMFISLSPFVYISVSPPPALSLLPSFLSNTCMCVSVGSSTVIFKFRIEFILYTGIDQDLKNVCSLECLVLLNAQPQNYLSSFSSLVGVQLCLSQVSVTENMPKIIS